MENQKSLNKWQYFGQMCKTADAFHVFNRNSERRWREAWSEEQLNWAIEKGFLMKSAPMIHLGESPNQNYYKFTRIGKEISDWYVYDTWFYIKHKVLHWNFWKYKVLRWNFWKYKVFKKFFNNY